MLVDNRIEPASRMRTVGVTVTPFTLRMMNHPVQQREGGRTRVAPGVIGNLHHKE